MNMYDPFMLSSWGWSLNGHCICLCFSEWSLQRWLDGGGTGTGDVSIGLLCIKVVLISPMML